MERDFLGLNSMEPLPASAKLDNSDEEKQWVFMKKVSSIPHFTQFRAGADQDNRMNNMNFSLSLSNPNMKPTSVGFGQQHEAILPPKGHVVGLTEPWNSSKFSATAPQMTIFYDGAVSVYDGISPETAQAIMLMAGNASFLGSSKNPPGPQVQNPSTKVPLSMTEVKDEKTAAKTTEISSATPSTIRQNQNIATSRGPVSMSNVTPSAVPQFRKASLARFLEKRKERVMNNGPYNFEKKHPDGGVSANDNLAPAGRSG